ncbi:MAG TPA: trehalose-6-phosphate synthase [Rhodanobacteraceae bacterium]|nr:trehalose-6-phosphate synthase [Rhodanobacteraceae bacterium]
MVVSNRIALPGDGQGGRLADILRCVLRMHGGLWFGWSGTIKPLPGLTMSHDRRGGFDIAAVDLDPTDHEAFYNGFSARALHPLLHSRLHDMEFSRDDMLAWFRVNDHLAVRLKEQLQPNDSIWVNDLHMLPMIGRLRELGVDNRIGLFLHEALPACNVLASLPCHDKVFGGLSACDLIGVQTARDEHVLHDYLTRFHAAVDRHGDRLRIGSRMLRLSAFPVGIDVKHISGLAQRADTRALFRRFRINLGSHKLLLGVDRVDHSKGLCQRLRAIDHLLRQSPQLAGTFSMLQISPSVRYDMPDCRDLDREICRHVSDINGRHGGPDWSPVRYVKKDFRRQVLAGYLRAADVGLMTPLQDGMNLTAKEYVACQDPVDPGVLVLSRFSGAACELTDALQVNPLDVGDMAAGIRTAMRMSLEERRARWESLMNVLCRQDLRRWGSDFLDALSRPSVVTRQPVTPSSVRVV